MLFLKFRIKVFHIYNLNSLFLLYIYIFCIKNAIFRLFVKNFYRLITIGNSTKDVLLSNNTVITEKKAPSSDGGGSHSGCANTNVNAGASSTGTSSSNTRRSESLAMQLIFQLFHHANLIQDLYKLTNVYNAPPREYHSIYNGFEGGTDGLGGMARLHPGPVRVLS